MTLIRYIFTLLTVSALALTSCLDDRLYDTDDLEIGDGVCNVPVKIEFRDMDPALESRAAGNAVHNVDNLWVVLYKVIDGQPVFFTKVLASGLSDYKCDQNGNSAEPGDVETGENLGSTGEKTPHATFTLNDIPFGRYQIYAVANVPGLTDADCEMPETLKSKSFAWDSTDVAQNNAMFGYFTTDENKKSQGFAAPNVVLNKTNISLHAWIKRLVSKVTVKFDATDLKESVRIYIKSVQIHDIPKRCFLGQNNAPASDTALIKNGEEFKYYTAATADNSQHDKWGIVLSRGKESNLAGSLNHSENDEALYFFENMQGNYPGQELFNKVQDPDSVGTAIDVPADGDDYKDRIPYGTYIEVIGYYASQNKEKLTHGPIKYRFMLGKDITYNYDAERNYHYKLTLKFRGWANEADWHISYTEHTPTLLVHEPYYISYLYGQSLDFPARVLTGDESVKDYKVKAEIIENGWWPYDEKTKAPPGQTVGALTDINGFAWNLQAYEGVYKDKNYVGFLSLRQNIGDIIAPPQKLDANGYGPNSNEWLENYYESNNIGWNEYPLNGANTSFDPIDKSVSLKIPMYTRQKEMVPASDFTGNNPFNCYTRLAKVKFTLLDPKGNQVEFLDGDGEKQTELVCRIIQVPRIDNPKAIYRAHDNKEPFKIELKVLQGAGQSNYVNYISDGPWRASIMCQTDKFIKLTGDDNKTVTEIGEYIDGSTDEAIAFTYEPSSTIGATETRCGIIKVEYNDYNCVHLIFVRQGYHKGVYLGNAIWSCYNVYAAANPGGRDNYAPGDNLTNVDVALTRSPLSIGSFLKRCQYNYSIRESNNDTYGWLKAIRTYNSTTASYNYYNLSTAYINASYQTINRNTPWSLIQGYGWTNFAGTSIRTDRKWATTWTARGGFQDGKTFKVPTAANFIALRDNCKFGSGIAYADGATKTATSLAEAIGYTDYNNTGVKSTNGMRVCVVYDENNGNNILFPLSAIGQGRRARNGATAIESWGSIPFSQPGPGGLTYSGMRQTLGGKYPEVLNQCRPLSFNLYRTPGSVYWIDQPMTKSPVTNLNTNSADYASWDINYITLVFNPYDYSSLGGYNGTAYGGTINEVSCSDALPIKLIYK